VKDGPRCLACGSADLTLWAKAEDVEYRTLPDTFEYLRCAQCQTLSINPVPVEKLSQIYPSNYYSFRGKSGSLTARVKEQLDRRFFRRLLATLPGSQLSALDVGGGAGQQLDTLRAADSRVNRTMVVDIDAGAKALALSAGHGFVQGRIEDAAIPGAFDVILLLNLIEHVSAPAEVLRKVRALLTPSGIVVVQTPNYESLDARLFRHRNWGGYHCPRHWAIFTRGGFQSLAGNAGLATRQWRFTQGAPFWAVSALWAMTRMGLTDVTRDRPAWQHPLYNSLTAAFAAFDFARGVFWPLSQMVFVLGRD